MQVRSLFLLLFTAANSAAAINFSRILDAGVNGFTTITATAVDSAGNLYLTGNTTTSTFPATTGALQPQLAPGNCSTVFDPHSPPIIGPCADAFVAKLDPTGKLAFATYLGGSGADFGLSIAIDATGAIYVAGRTYHQLGALNDFPTTPNAAYRNQSTLISDGFVTKLNPAGNTLLYSTLIPGAANGAVALAVDAAGNVYFGGNVLPSDGVFPVSAGAFQTSAKMGASHSVVAKLNPSGSALLYSTYVSGSYDTLEGLALDATGNVYITGTTYSSDFPVTSGTFQTVPPNPNISAFVSKLNATGSALIYSTFLGGGSLELASAIRVDSQGDAVVLCATDSKNFPTTSGAFQPALSSALVAHGLIVKLNPQGSALVYATFFDGAASIDLDAAGNTYVSATYAYDFPVTPGASQRCAANNQDAVIAELDPKGALLAASYLGGSGADIPTRAVVASDGSVYATGITTSADFPGAPLPAAGYTHPFISKLRIADPTQNDLPCVALVTQNGASFAEAPAAAGELVTLRGLGLGPLQPSTSAGVKVFFDGIPAPILYAQSRQINVQVPWELAGRARTQLHVEYNGASSNAASILLAAEDVGLFSRLDGTSQGAIINQDGTPNSPSNPAKRGSVVEMYGTGGGALSPSGTTGGVWPLTPLAMLPQPVSVRIGAFDADVVYAGSAPFQSSGIFQINARVPESLSASSSWGILVNIAGFASAGSCCVTIAVQ